MKDGGFHLISAPKLSKRWGPPLFPLLPNINPIMFLLTLSALIYLDTLITRRLRKEVAVLSGERYFTVCPRCRYDQTALVDRCIKCDYREGTPITLEDSRRRFIELPASDILDEREQYRAEGLESHLPQKALSFVELDSDEFILIAYKKPLGASLLINEARELVNYVIFSTKRITLLHYFSESEGWRFREMIPYEDIRSLSVLMKQYSLAKLPTLIIKTADSSYELSFGHNRSEMKKIMDIAKCIQKRAPGSNVEIEKLESPSENTDLNTDLHMDVKDLFKSPWQK